MEASLMCSSRIVITSLDCEPGGPGFKSEWVTICGSIDFTGLTQAFIPYPFGIVNWVPVLSNIKTATWCELIRQLQLRTVFAGTVVYN